jgi:fructosamine-3-kinase
MLAAASVWRGTELPMQQERLSDWLNAVLGQPVRRMAAVQGGCIHNAWALELNDGTHLFAKSNRLALRPVLESEAMGLEALADAASTAASAPLIPKPLICDEVDDWAVLVMSWLDLGQPIRGSGGDAWEQLGADLARLHRASCQSNDQRYGWEHDNFIGSGHQRNRWCSSWCTFFARERLGLQLQQLQRPIPGAQELLDQLPHWLESHQPDACLVHGDLWSGNAGLLRHGGGALFDPAVYRGDREVDLAMAQLFGGFPQAFFKGYQQEWPLPSGHAQRVELYNLYHLLNHANLFGGSYWQQSAVSIENLLRCRR